MLDAITNISTRIIENTSNEAGGSGSSRGADNAEVKAGIENLQTMLVAQDAKMDKMAEMGKENSWTDVVRRKHKKNAVDVIPTLETAASQKAATRNNDRCCQLRRFHCTV